MYRLTIEDSNDITVFEHKLTDEEYNDIVNRIDIDGWKGKDTLEISEGIDYYRVTEHRKNKETGKVSSPEHIIPAGNVNALWNILCNYDVSEKVRYRVLVRRLCETFRFAHDEELELSDMINAFNGGSYRSKYYFPYYYYPLKILEFQEKVKYFGRGGAMRLQ